jgi:hypothetical protein
MLVASLFPGDDKGRVPVIAVVGDRGTGKIAREAEAVLRAAGNCPGLLLRDHAFVGGQCVALDSVSRLANANQMLCNLEVDHLVASVSVRRVYRYGLQLDRCDAAVLMPQRRPASQEHFRKGLEILVAANTGSFLVMSSDSIALRELKDLDSERLLLIASSESDGRIIDHVNAGYSAVDLSYLRGRAHLNLYREGSLITTIEVNTIAEPVRTDRFVGLQAKMFALGLAGAMGLTPNAIKQGVLEARSVRLPSNAFFHIPERMNAAL